MLSNTLPHILHRYSLEGERLGFEAASSKARVILRSMLMSALHRLSPILNYTNLHKLAYTPGEILTHIQFEPFSSDILTNSLSEFSE